MRIVSLLPSTTEIACALGLESQLVGRSHECDYPESIKDLPVLTEPKYDENGRSSEIDKRVKSLLENGLSVYHVFADKLSELNPDLILTQDHCEVCAVSLPDVEEALQKYTSSDSKVISVSPKNLEDIFESIQTIGNAAGAGQKAKHLLAEIKQRFSIIKNTVFGENRKTVATVEWIEPLMTAGNWIPELIEIAGGEDQLGKPGQHSPWIDWNDIMEADPEYLLICPCGYSCQQTLNEIDHLTDKPEWEKLKAVKNGNVFILDGNHYFNRPGPRIFESTRILGEILHPQLFKPTLKGIGWINFRDIQKTELTA